ncbi:MAG: penicillin-binding protein [Pseudomonadota bacterium]
MNVKGKKWIRFRIYLIAFFFSCGLATVLARAYQLQVLERDKLTSIAISGYKNTVKLPSKRGAIYDRSGQDLAISVEVGSIYAHPHLVKQKWVTAEKLSRILGIEKKDVLQCLKDKRPFVWIRRKTSPEEVERIKSLGLEGIGFATESKRYYPGKEIAGQLLGFVGQDNQGLEGLEKYYDELLKGPQYTLNQMRDALGRPFSVNIPDSHDQAFNNLHLTIDKNIQYQAEQALQKAVQKAKAKSGHCIILNPQTGEILAMAVFPLFNPNIFSKFSPHQWRNIPVTDCYEPGSTIKPFLVSAALDKNIVSPQTKFYCEQGQYRVANHIIHDTKKHGSLDVSEIVIVSSNIGAMKIGQKLGYRVFYDYLMKFGFGEKTGIDLMGERVGTIRSLKEARELDQATTYFGQGMSTTSIQLAAAMAAIANGGKLMRPFVVKKITDQYGNSVKKTSPKMIRRVLKEETAEKVKEILTGVVSTKGTASLAAISGYSSAGKTGTSQKIDPQTKGYSDKNYIALFLGFTPADDPKLLILISIDEPSGIPYGGLVAAPVFSEIGTWSLNHLHIKPQVRVTARLEEPENDPVMNAEQNGGSNTILENLGLLPDFKGKTMREVLKSVKALGLQVTLEGTGLAFKQIPEPGVPIEIITNLKVVCRSPT